jgi:hypothetical protein
MLETIHFSSEKATFDFVEAMVANTGKTDVEVETGIAEASPYRKNVSAFLGSA